MDPAIASEGLTTIDPRLLSVPENRTEILLDGIIRVANNIQISDLAYDSRYEYRPSDSLYEPQVMKRSSHNGKRLLEGLCPYCHEIRFYDINSSAYLHHLIINHGVFSNGNKIRNPYKSDNSTVQCPYQCQAQIKLKKNLPVNDPNRYKSYCRHVRQYHYEGKKGGIYK